MISDCLRNLNDHACSTSNLSCGDRRQPRQLERTSSFGKGRLIGYSNLAKEYFPRQWAARALQRLPRAGGGDASVRQRLIGAGCTGAGQPSGSGVR